MLLLGMVLESQDMSQEAEKISELTVMPSV